jgi:hypothetical protein
VFSFNSFLFDFFMAQKVNPKRMRVPHGGSAKHTFARPGGFYASFGYSTNFIKSVMPRVTADASSLHPVLKVFQKN